MVHQRPFQPSLRFAAQLHQPVEDERWLISTLGAPEIVLASCTRILSEDGVR